jgi:hypothetical protein
MCEICHQFPCDSRCPNATEAPVVFVCSGCGKNIHEGDDYWEIMGEQWCEKCIKHAHRVAEFYEEDEYDPY